MAKTREGPVLLIGNTAGETMKLAVLTARNYNIAVTSLRQ